LKVSAPLPVFVSVTEKVLLAIPCPVEPNDKLVGTLTAGAVPVPVRVTVCGLPAALSAKLNVADSAAVVEGVKVIITVQLPVGATGVATTQVFAAMLKSAAFGPEMVGVLVKVRLALPVFISVTVRVALVVPLGTRLKGRVVGSVTTGAGAVPVPERATVCGLLAALSAKVNVADSAAAVEGFKVIMTAQDAFAAT